MEQCFQEGQNVAAILGHYCNWEWLSCVGIELPKSRKMGLIYHPLRNQAFDELFKRIRSHEENGVVVPKKNILRYLVDYKRKGIMSIFGYISDQGPKWENIHLWLPFLNHPETPVFTGGERIMRKMNDAVFYVEMSRPKRGYYTATYKLITRNPNSCRSTRLPVASSRCWKKPSARIHLIIYGHITGGSEPRRSLTSDMKSKMVK